MTEVAEHPSAISASDPRLGSTDAAATLEGLHRRAEDIVDILLRKNAPHWQSLSEADRRTVELLARTIASRLLDRPARRLAAESSAAAQATYVTALRRLFALDAYATSRSPDIESRST